MYMPQPHITYSSAMPQYTTPYSVPSQFPTYFTPQTYSQQYPNYLNTQPSLPKVKSVDDLQGVQQIPTSTVSTYFPQQLSATQQYADTQLPQRQSLPNIQSTQTQKPDLDNEYRKRRNSEPYSHSITADLICLGRKHFLLILHNIVESKHYCTVCYVIPHLQFQSWWCFSDCCFQGDATNFFSSTKLGGKARNVSSIEGNLKIV